MANKVQYTQVLPGHDVADIIDTLNFVGYTMAQVGIFFDSTEELRKSFGQVEGKIYRVTFEEVKG